MKIVVDIGIGMCDNVGMIKTEKTTEGERMVEQKTYCARNYTIDVPVHACTGGPYCKGGCKPGKQATNQLHRGDVVRDCMGHTWTVQDHIGTTVYVYGCMGKTLHRTKCTKVVV